MTDDVCQCVKCGRMHRRLGKPPWINRSRVLILRISNAVKRLNDAGVDRDVADLAKILDERIAD